MPLLQSHHPNCDDIRSPGRTGHNRGSVWFNFIRLELCTAGVARLGRKRPVFSAFGYKLWETVPPSIETAAEPPFDTQGPDSGLVVGVTSDRSSSRIADDFDTFPRTGPL